MGATRLEVKVEMEAKMKLNCSLSNSRTTCADATSSTPDTPEILNTILNILPQKRDDVKNDHDREETKDTKENNVMYSDCMYERNAGERHDSSEGNEENKESVRDVLKMRVKRKRKYSGSKNVEFEQGLLFGKAYNQGLTVDDEVRRQRRRERNKVAATKCRNKKKERTTRLIAEGEVLEIQNECLKEEMVRLEIEYKHLTKMLAQHEPSCEKKIKREESPGSVSYENKSCLFDVNANKIVNANKGNINPVYSDCKYNVKEEDRFYENDNSVSDASPVDDDIYLDEYSESFGSTEDFQGPKQDWYNPNYWNQRQSFPINQGGIMPCQEYPWPVDYECMTL